MAQGAFILSDETFTGINGIYCPASVLACWNVPPKPTDGRGGANPIEVTPYTFKEARDAARLGSAPYFPIAHVDGEVPERTTEGLTHWVVPVNNVTIEVFNDCVNLAEAGGVPRGHVYMPTNQLRNYFATGELPV